jgi:hypothetical protein
MITKAGRDPRTIARNIPGILNAVFPCLTPSIVALYNRSAEGAEVVAVSPEDIQASQLQKSLLFELGFAVAEQLLAGNDTNWEKCVTTAVARQSRFFDAIRPSEISVRDQDVALRVGKNLAIMINNIAINCESPYCAAPIIPGFRWIASGHGDFSAGSTLIEVKCIAGNFSAADYRQVAMYWLLSYAAALETGNPEWKSCILLNPRLAKMVRIDFNEFIKLTSGGRSKTEVLQYFAAILKDINDF